MGKFKEIDENIYSADISSYEQTYFARPSYSGLIEIFKNLSSSEEAIKSLSDGEPEPSTDHVQFVLDQQSLPL